MCVCVVFHCLCCLHAHVSNVLKGGEGGGLLGNGYGLIVM